MIKLIALDIDGTIARGNRLNKKDIEALAKAQKKGIIITLATGRNMKSVFDVANRLGILNPKTPFIGQNGGQIFYFNDDGSIKVIDNRIFTDEESIYLFELAKKYKIKLFSYTENPHLSYSNSKYNPFIFVMKLISKRKAIVYKNKRTKFKSPNSKFVAFGKNKNLRKYKKDILDKGYSAFALSYKIGNNENLEIVPSGLNKQVGLEQVAKILKIKQNEIMYFGDGENDMEAIKWAGIGVAMGNAPDDVKAIAKIVTDSVSKSGVAKEVEKILKS